MYLVGAISYTNAHFGAGSGQIWLDEVRCNEYDYSLTSCLANSFGNNDCSHGEDAGVRCTTACKSLKSLRS